MIISLYSNYRLCEGSTQDSLTKHNIVCKKYPWDIRLLILMIVHQMGAEI